MSKIIGDHSIKNECSQLAETKNGFFINNNYYDKKMNPTAFLGATINGRGEHLQTNMNALLKSFPSTNKSNKFKYTQTFSPLTVIDKEDINISYSIYCNYYSTNKEVNIIKYKEDNDKGITILNNSFIGSKDTSSYNSWYQPFVILAQTKTHIYIGCSYFYNAQYSYAFSLLILKYNKTTGNINIAYNNNPGENKSSCFSPLISNESEIYFFLHSTVSSTIIKYSTITNDAVSIKTLDTTSLTERFFDNITIVNENKVEFIYPQLTNGTPIAFKKIELDTSKELDANKVTITDINVSYNDVFTNMILPGRNSYGLMYHSFENTTSNGITYYNIAVYTINNDFDGKAYEGIYTYKKMPDGTLEAKGYTIFSLDNITTGFLLSKNKNWFITGSQTTVSCYYFNEVQEKFVKKFDLNGLNPFSMGLDINEKIWVIDGNYNVHCFSNAIAKDVKLTLNKKAYKFEGEEINATLSVTCKNYENISVSTNLILNMQGPVEFLDNGLKTLQVSVTEEQPLVVPIKIKDSGDITVSSKIIL